MPTERHPHRLRGLALVLLASVALVAGLVALFDQGAGPLPDPEGCRARVGGVVVDLDTEQAENATTISAVAVRRGLPARAASIALATAFQESKLRNLDHGDRDSVGLFQQRPSQGWGTTTQILDPYYAANKFYDELQRIDGYQQMRITEAAQRVQRSGYPEAYQAHAADGRALASALTGYSPAAFSCVVHSAGTGLAAQPAGTDGLTARADRVRRALRLAFGDVPIRRVTGTTHALAVSVRPASSSNQRLGWAMSSYLVAHASRLHIDRVVFDQHIWRVGAASEHGWRASAADVHGAQVRVEVLAGH